MSLDMTTNMMAIDAAQQLSVHYQALATSTQRLSSGLRINSAADDPAGLAVSDEMGVSIAGMNQGVRNATDGLSMAQTADGAISVIDQNLTTMQDLAEQASTGTYTTAQRAIMDSEYQAMAAEIDRIANATNFNGVSLLNGSLSTMNNGSGMLIHFGTGNSSAGDYYYINIGDMRATTATGLQVGGGATADIFTNNNVVSSTQTLSGGYFAFGYNQGGTTDTSAGAVANIAGFYQATSDVTTLSDLVAEINQGTAARVQLTLGTALTAGDSAVSMVINGTKYAFQVTSDSSATALSGYNIIDLTSGGAALASYASQVSAFVNAINNQGGPVWAVEGSDSSSIYLFARQAGVAGNAYTVSDSLTNGGFYSGTGSAAGLVSSTTMSGGGQTWAVADEATATGGYNLSLTGASTGANYGIEIEDPHTLLGVADLGSSQYSPTAANWTETPGSGSGSWNGADILTQSDAANALGAIAAAVLREDQARASLGSTENRLTATIQNLQVQTENLQSAQSNITDVDVATEMTNFTTQSILTQAATAMLAQANALPRLALTLLGGGGGAV